MQAPSSNTSKQQAERLPGRELENDSAENPCFGCGPDNVDGLRLRFFDDGEVVRSRLVLDERFSSWPGFANGGIAFTALIEVGGWAVWERLGPSRIASPFTFEMLGIPQLREAVVEARLDDARPIARVDTIMLQAGVPVARASWQAKAGTPDEARKMLSLPNLPRSLKPGFEERARERA